MSFFFLYFSRIPERVRKLIEEEYERVDPRSMQDLLLKESVYNGIGKCLGDLGESIDFDEWLRNSLIPEALSTDTKYVSSYIFLFLTLSITLFSATDRINSLVIV